MSEQRRTPVIWLTFAWVLAASAPALAEEDATPAPKAVKTEYTWVASEAGEPIGIERTKGVVSTAKKRFLSSEFVPGEGQTTKRRTTVHWRDPDGTLRKYFRKIEVRLGKGVRAFRRGVGIRIVGVNQKRMEPVEIPKASEHHVWDPSMLSGLALWLELASTAGETSFKVLDMDQRTSVTARMVPVESTIVGDPGGKPATLACWKAWAGGAEVATLCGDGAGVLVSVRAGRRTLLLESWTWEVPKSIPAEETATATDDAAPGADEAPTEEPGVGP